MNTIKAILTRRSNRTFNGLHLDPAILNSISSSCHKLCNEPSDWESSLFQNIRRPEIILLPDFKASGMPGTYGVIKGACSYIAMSNGNSLPEQMLGGVLMEAIVLECTKSGLGTCWLGGTFDKSDFQAKFNELTGNSDISKKITAVTPIGHCTQKKRFAERMMRRVISADNRKPFKMLFQGIDEPSEQLMQDLADDKIKPSELNLEQKIAVTLECVRRAPSSTNSQPWRAVANRNANGKITGISFSCVSNGRFAAYDMGIAYCHLLQSCNFLEINGMLQHENGKNPCELLFTSGH